MNINIKDIVANASHLHTVFSLLTDAFSTGRVHEGKEADPTAAYKKMMDEAIGLNTYRLLRERLAAEGIEVDPLYRETAAYFRQKPFYIPAWRESLAAVADAEARVGILREFVCADEVEKDLLCQQIDQRHPAARALFNQFINARNVWNRVFGRPELTLEQARDLRSFVASLGWRQRIQFRASIGALTSADERHDILREILEVSPNHAQMQEIAFIRGLIKGRGQAGARDDQMEASAWDQLADWGSVLWAGLRNGITQAALAFDQQCGVWARQLHEVNKRNRERRRQLRSSGVWFVKYFSGR